MIMLHIILRILTKIFHTVDLLKTTTLSRDKKKLGRYSFGIYQNKQIEPELWLHLQIPNKVGITAFQMYSLDTSVQSQVSKIFKAKFNVDAELMVRIEEGSIWVKIKPKLGTLAIIITIYVGLHEMPRYLSRDINYIWHCVIPEVVQVVEDVFTKEDNSIRIQRGLDYVHILEIRQHKGIIERLDETLEEFRKEEITQDQCIKEITKTFKAIYSSGGARDVAPALVKYIDAKFPDTFPWDSLVPDMKAIIRKEEELE